MKIKSQTNLIGLLGIITVCIAGVLVFLQLQNGTDLSLKMQNHQKALVQLNNYQVSAITQILLSVDLVRTGDIRGDRIVQYRMSETRLSREVENLGNLSFLAPSLSEAIGDLQKAGSDLSALCKTKLMEPLYSRRPLESGIIEQLIYTELIQLNTQVNGIEDGLNDIIKADLAAQVSQRKKLNRYYMLPAGLLLILYILVSHLIISRSLKHINWTKKFLGDLAEGNTPLEASMAERGNDEISQLRRNFNRFMKNLSERHDSLKTIASSQVDLSGRLNSLALEHAAASLQLDTSLNNVSGRSKKMTAQAEASLKEIHSISRAMDNLENLARSLEQQIADMASQGEKIRSALITQEYAVDKQVNLTYQVKEESLNSKRILDLLKDQILEIISQSSTISGTIHSIEDLADQTDILAINASIESAHSGRHGRGFTVVAGEMRNLSGQVRLYAEDISALLKELNGKLNLMSEEEQENRDSFERLIGQNVIAESAVEDLKSSSKRMGRAIKDFFALVESAKDGSADVHSETEMVRNSGREIFELMEKMNSNQKKVQEETVEMTQAVTQLSQGSAMLEKLSGDNMDTAGNLEEEIRRLGS